jgi:hypothetical protein
LALKKNFVMREADKVTLQSAPTQGEPDAVVSEADLLNALILRDLEKALSKRIERK